MEVERTETYVIEKKSERGKSKRFYSPLVLNIARKEGITFDELETIDGSGLNGRVTKKDILAYLEKRNEAKTQTSARTFVFDGETEIIPMDNIRKKIMRHMIASRDTSVHVSEVVEVDMTKIHNFIEANKERFAKEENLKLTYMAFISYAAVKTLKQYPLMNASIDGENIVMKKYVNLGIAVAVEPNGLIVPNIKSADNMNVRGLAKAIAELSYKARNKKLSPDDVVDGTFSITNYGVFGALFGTPIINQPEVGILGVGAVVKRPVVVTAEFGDTIAIKPMMYLTLSHDHRLVDGMLGGLFLKAVKETLENFDVSIV
jgi:2-oxoglutarate dehydrogenase E2 component (dihydrolipoamide succinyltransferase)